VGAGDEALVLQVGDVLVHGGQGFEAEAAGDFLIGRGIAVALHETGDEVEHFFLPPGDRHGSSIANKKGIESENCAEVCKSATGAGFWDAAGRGGGCAGEIS